MKDELLKGLSEEQIAKIKSCKNSEEILSLAKEEGIELTDEQLEVVSGGCKTRTPIPPCPKCGSTNVSVRFYGGYDYYTCFTCCPDYIWKVPAKK